MLFELSKPILIFAIKQELGVQFVNVRVLTLDFCSQIMV
jgi:hypothetical protein